MTDSNRRHTDYDAEVPLIWIQKSRCPICAIMFNKISQLASYLLSNFGGENLFWVAEYCWLRLKSGPRQNVGTA